MISACIPEIENERLSALYKYGILDTDAEHQFDELTRLASDICETPIALISLVDPERQWFKSVVGLEARETSREIAFCSHAILEKDIFEITDASKDERFHDNPLVQGPPGIRFYAGAPLFTPEGYAIGTLCTISDEPKKLSDSQRRALKTLSNQVVSQLELRLKVKQLEEASEHKSSFLSFMSHEIRTPLNAIIGFSQVFLEQSEMAKVPAHLIRYARAIDFSGQRLSGLVNSVLDLAKIEAGKMELAKERFNVRHLMSGIHEMLGMYALDQNVHFDYQLSESVSEDVFQDKTRLSQVITNLAHNAIKFTGKGQRVTVLVDQYDDKLKIRVCDEGIGMSQDDISKLFNKFNQVGSGKQSHYGGTGLGLAISKGIVELMDGEIAVSSVQGQGTCFTVTIPIEVCHSANDCGAADLVQQFPDGINVLVVEDDEISMTIVKVLLESLKVSVHCASTGEAALELVDAVRPDVVFMDMNLPGLSGQQAAAKIHNNPELADIKVIALSADAFTEDISDVLSESIQDYLTKPVRKDDLMKVLNRWCGRSATV